jgi:hypothetical protein
MGWGFFRSAWLLFVAGALAACASKSSDPQSGNTVPYEKYSCDQLLSLRGAGVGTTPDDGGRVTVNLSKRDLAEVEGALRAKGCNINLR